ncbi:hypothetical protein BHE74_00029482 [Ensete ventricosum]|nr:hypothetical protein BHE74_00029482 [Ensete ventricosum]
MRKVIDVYKQNARTLAETFGSMGLEVYGGSNSPYVWVRFPGRRSWDVFTEILEETHVITVPGCGFGPGGEGFIRLSSFNSEECVREANMHHHLLQIWLPPPTAERKNSLCLHTMVSMGASYGHLHIQQEHYRQKMRRKEEEKKAMEEQQQTKKKKKKKMMKGGCNASVHPKGLSESQAKGMAG